MSLPGNPLSQGTTDKLAVGLVIGLVLVVAYALKKTVDAGALNVGAAAGKAAGDLGAGVILGVGDSIGVPRTDMTECERAMAEGRTLDASFACPASTFLKYLFGSKTPQYIDPNQVAGP